MIVDIVIFGNQTSKNVWPNYMEKTFGLKT